MAWVEKELENRFWLLGSVSSPVITSGAVTSVFLESPPNPKSFEAENLEGELGPMEPLAWRDTV